MRILSRSLLGALGAALVLPCATAALQGSRAGVAATATSDVMRRAQQYWTRRQAKDLQGAYPFYCADFKRRIPFPQFMGMTRLTRFQLMDVHVTGATPLDNRMEVTVEYRYLAPMISGEPLKGELKDLWAKGPDGRWCKEDEPSGLPTPKGTIAE